MKLVYDKYANSQYSERTLNCPLCSLGPDIREHLFDCQCTEAIAINKNATSDAERLPVPEEVCSRVLLSTEQILILKQTVLQLVRRTSFSRIGLFNRNERQLLLELFLPRNDGDWLESSIDMYKMVHSYLMDVIKIYSRAERAINQLRNDKFYQIPKCESIYAKNN
jgi:hypothetical protein